MEERTWRYSGCFVIGQDYQSSDGHSISAEAMRSEMESLARSRRWGDLMALPVERQKHLELVALRHFDEQLDEMLNRKSPPLPE